MPNRTRLILNSDSIKVADVHTFRNAAITILKDYKAKYPLDTVKIAFVHSGKDIVNQINSTGIGKLISLDIISHGNQGGIHIARKLKQPEKSGILQRNMHVLLRRHSDKPQTEADAEFMEESMHGLYSGYFSKLGVAYYYNQTYERSTDIAFLQDIEFSRFSDKSVVEFHGCRTAEIIPALNSWIKDNFAEDFSEQLGNKGIVIGHVTNSTPNKNPNGNPNDYRYGKVRVYKNGKLIKDNVERQRLTFENSSTPNL
jgi:hypothetical protein